MVFSALTAEDDDFWPACLAHYCGAHACSINTRCADYCLVSIAEQDNVTQNNLLALRQSSRSTRMVSSLETRYCLPPVFTKAYMAIFLIKTSSAPKASGPARNAQIIIIITVAAVGVTNHSLFPNKGFLCVADARNRDSGLKYTLCDPAVKCPDAFVLVLHHGLNCTGAATFAVKCCFT